MTDEQDPPLPIPGTRVRPGYQGGAEFFMDFATVPGLHTMLKQATAYSRQAERFIREHAAFKGGEDSWPTPTTLCGKRSALSSGTAR
jgi:hypothetical protein